LSALAHPIRHTSAAGVRRTRASGRRIRSALVGQICQACLVCLGLLALAREGRAADDGSGGAKAAEDSGLLDRKGFREMASHDNWTLYFQKNTLDIWRGKPPYDKMRNGQANFVVTFRHPIRLVVDGKSLVARSAALRYLFACYPPPVSVFSRVDFYMTPFAPRDSTLWEQWNAYRQRVHTVEQTVEPEAVPWKDILDRNSMDHWSAAWKKIYRESCSQ